MKKVSIRSFSGPYFPEFGLNTKRYRGSLRIQSECRKITDENDFQYRHFSRSDIISEIHAKLEACGSAIFLQGRAMFLQGQAFVDVPFLLMSPLNVLFLKEVTKNVHENQQAKSRAS